MYKPDFRNVNNSETMQLLNYDLLIINIHNIDNFSENTLNSNKCKFNTFLKNFQ